MLATSPAESLVRLLDRLELDDPAGAAGPELHGPLLARVDHGGARAADAPLLAAALAADETGVVRVEARADEGAGAARIVVRTLSEYDVESDPARPIYCALEMPPDPRLNPELGAPLDPALGGEWRRLEIAVPAVPRREGIAVEVEGTPAGWSIGAVEVERIEPWQRALRGKRRPDDDSTSRARRIVRRASARADCLVLAAGARARCEVLVPESRPRVELLLARVAPPGAAPLTLHVRIDGTALASESLAGTPGIPEPPFMRRTIGLEAFAGRRVEIAFEAEGAAGSAVLVGAPELLGSASGAKPPSLVFISIDTLRADHVGCYGAREGLTPAIDRVAAEGARFERVVAASSWTLPSHATMFTGETPIVHGAVDPSVRVDGDATPMLAELLAERGYATAAFTGGGYVDPVFGFGAGFDCYSWRDPCRIRTVAGREPPAEDRLAPALDWLARHDDQPFFLFLHTYVVHDYAPLDEFVARVRTAGDPEVEAFESERLRVALAAGETRVIDKLKLLYRSALLQADERLVGRVVQELDRRGLSESTVVSIVSDHGEEWLEHEGALHSLCLWGELTSVPWVVRGPGVERGALIDGVTGHADVGPTLASLLGVSYPGPVRGKNRLDGSVPPRPILSYVVSPDHGEVDLLELHPWKLLRHRAEDDPAAGESDRGIHLFRIDVDPLERDDLFDSERSVVRALLRLLDAELARARAEASARVAGSPASVELDEETRETLRKLGYLDD